MNTILSYGNNMLTLSLFSAIIFLMSSISLHIIKKEKLSILFLLLTGFCFYCFAALLDPYINIWDERFHALVAKNLMKHPLLPTLYDDPIVNMAYDRWDRYHIWLHKQPLFLWQIALCFKLFGVSEFSLRIPNIISGVILIYAGYRTGKLLVNNRVGYLTGIFIISTYYIFELIAGRQAVDHNDLSFLFYISISIWSFIEYYYSGKKHWIFLIGLFSGMAILCKWLVGLLVYFGWFLLKLQQKKFKIHMYKDLLISLSVTLVVAAPWQIFTFIAYPNEAIKAYEFNYLHFIKALDGHNGSVWYYLENFSVNYGKLAPFLVIPAFIVLFKKMNDKKLFYVFVGMVLIVYLFFTSASTKMLSFPTVVSMIILIAFGSLFDYILSHIEILKIKKALRIFFYLGIIILALSRFDFKTLKENHISRNTENSYSYMLIHNKKIFTSLDLPENAVLFNVKGRHYVEAMFYTGIPAYNFIPSENQYKDLKAKGRTIVIFRPGNIEIPEYLKNDVTIKYIDQVLQGYD